MRVRGVLAIAAVLMGAAIGLAMTSAGNAASPAQEPNRPQERQIGPPRGPRDGGPEGIERLLFEVDLAAAQRDQIVALTAADREATAATRVRLREAGDDLRSFIEADTFDEAAVRDLAATEAALSAELRVSSARTEAAIYQLLTPDQKVALSALRNPRPSRLPRR